MNKQDLSASELPTSTAGDSRSKEKPRFSGVFYTFVARGGEGTQLVPLTVLSPPPQTHISRLPPGAVAGQSVAIEGGVCRLESPVS